MAALDTAPVRARRRGKSAVLATLRLMLFDVLRSLGTWRWLFVPPVYALIGAYYGGLLEFDFDRQQPRSINLWDVPPAVVSNRNLNVWLVGLGFALLVGDSYLRDRDRNTLALTLGRAPSRTAWWVAKMGAIGLQSLCYVGLMFAALLTGSLFSVPFALGDSPQSSIPTNWNDLWYPRMMSVPMPLFVLLVGLYTAFALWIIGCVVMTSALLAGRAIVPLATSVVWALASVELAPVLSGLPYGLLLSMPYFITYAKHFLPRDGTPFWLFITASLGLLLSLVALGAWRLQRLDV
jgi:hypothetical protein